MNRVQVIWSTEALVDLEVIYDFLAEHSHRAAQKTILKILTRVKQIEAFPESGAVQLELARSDKEYRYLVEGNYKIVYRVTDKQVYIVAVFDTRYDPDKLNV